MKHPRNKDELSMSSVDYDRYQRALDWMERKEALNNNISRQQARSRVARRVGIAPGTIENIARGRLKSLAGRVERAIDAALVKLLQQQIGGLQHELDMAQARLGRADLGVVAQAEAARDALAALIEEARS